MPTGIRHLMMFSSTQSLPMFPEYFGAQRLRQKGALSRHSSDYREGYFSKTRSPRHNHTLIQNAVEQRYWNNDYTLAKFS